MTGFYKRGTLAFNGLKDTHRIKFKAINTHLFKLQTKLRDTLHINS